MVYMISFLIRFEIPADLAAVQVINFVLISTIAGNSKEANEGNREANKYLSKPKFEFPFRLIASPKSISPDTILYLRGSNHWTPPGNIDRTITNFCAMPTHSFEFDPLSRRSFP